MKRSIGVYLAACLAALSVQTASSVAQAAPAAPDSPVTLATTAADAAAASGLDALAKGPDEQFQRKAVYTGGIPGKKDLFYVSYDRTYKGLPVIGGDAVVATDAAGKILDTVAANEGGLAVDTRARVSVQRAKAIARGQLSKVDKVEGGTLSVLAEDHGKLVYEVIVSGQREGAPSRLHVYVNAHDGAVEDLVDDVKAGTGNSEWNGPNPLNIDTSNNSTVDDTRPGLRCVDYATNQPFSKPSNSFGTGKATSKETGCADVLWSTQKQWDMLKNWLGRNGIDGNGRGVTVKVGLDKVNAYWTGQHIEIGRNNANQWIASMDVVGHEHGHAIDQYTPGGAGREAGLGEATGDIMGALTEAYANEPSPFDTPDYLVGEKVNLVGQGPIRNMADPKAVGGHPNCWSSAIPGTEVHAAAGPLNHWFYLLAEGSSPGGGKPNSPTCDGSTVRGIGIQAAGRVFYNAMLLKTSTMTHFKYRVATLTAAKALDPTCAQYNVVKAAWQAISVPAQAGEPTCVSTPVDDFSLALNPSSVTVPQGGQGTATLSSTTTSGNPQSVALSASGAPSGVVVKFNPETITSGQSSTVNVTVPSSTPAGTYPVTVQGKGGATHTASFNVVVTGTAPVNDFSIALNPSSGDTNPGGSVTTTVGTTVTSGESQKVSLSASGLPAGATATFSPATIAAGESSKLTIATTAATPAGTHTVTVTGAGADASHSATYTLRVGGEPPANDFSVALNPTSGTVQAGSSATSTVSTTTTAGSPHKVHFAASGLPTGATATFTPLSVESGESSTLTIATAATTPEGTYTITVTATGTDTSHTATYTLTVQGGGGPGGCDGVPAWDASTAYVPNDEVSHNSHKWKSTWYSTGAEPGHPGSWAVWQDQGAC
ncbi:Zn-dependent metalloprotease [Saccharothrix tamanrassetensis]|uniref:Zn-dependent metalloprotease n=1 Tax=Saccharothrix tamanrassetensis TaxID=1051531 RepID=A0A841CPP7_9PSEU|nr:M4 family metallopeptidase [Saccharothrix tamanrassetensis]MBB5957466.1 Zn-dependent metalloprotease [Saccharothrix tamanrassetensis]